MCKTTLLLLAAAAALSLCHPAIAQDTPSSTSLCDLSEYRGTDIYNKYCSAAPQTGATGDVDNQAGLAAAGALGNAIGAGIHAMIEHDKQVKAQEEAAAAAAAAKRKQEQEQLRAASQARLLGAGGVKQSGGGAVLAAKAYRPPELAFKLATTPGAAAQTAPLPASSLSTDAAPNAGDAYGRGLQDAADCIAQSAGAFCVGGDAAQTQACVEGYEKGYGVGNIGAENTLRMAYDEGRALKAAGKGFVAFSRPAQGQCGVHASVVYAAGYNNEPFSAAGR